MNTYIALLRAVNVSGHNILKMKDLAKMLSENGFGRVQTYIQSGNLVLTHGSASCKEVEEMLETLILKHFGLDVRCMVRTSAQWEAVLERLPYQQDAEVEKQQVYVAFLKEEKPIDPQKIADLQAKHTPDTLTASGAEVFVYYPAGAGQSKLSNNLIENKLGVVTTLRNLNTVLKMKELATENL